MNCASASPARYLHVLQLFTPPTPALPSRAECCFSGNVLRSHFHNTKYKMLISGDCFRPPPQDGSWHLPDYDLKNVWLIKHGSYQRGFSREKSELIGAGAGWRPRPRQPATHLIVRTLILSSCPDLCSFEHLGIYAFKYNSYNDINIKDTEKTSKTRDMWQIQTAKSNWLNIYFESIKKNHKSANNDSKYNTIPTERI